MCLLPVHRAFSVHEFSRLRRSTIFFLWCKNCAKHSFCTTEQNQSQRRRRKHASASQAVIATGSKHCLRVDIDILLTFSSSSLLCCCHRGSPLVEMSAEVAQIPASP